MEKEAVQRCPRCGQDKPRAGYHPDKWGKPGHYCRPCVVEYKREWNVKRGITRRHGPDPAPPPRKAPVVSHNYHAMHVRIWKARGKAAAHPCANGCGQQAAHWAYDHKDPDEVTGWSNQGRNKRRVPVTFSLKMHHYLPLCRSCHTTLDNRGRPTKCPNCGHQFAPGGTQGLTSASMVRPPEPTATPVTKW